MDEKWINDRIRELQLDKNITSDQIPNIDLYMDQVITLFEDKLQHTKRYEEDKLLTKTMINNYTKDKLLMPAVKKKYTKDHMILMILLYQLKQVLSIGDIKDLFAGMTTENTVDSNQLESLYESYLMCKDKLVCEFEGSVDRKLTSMKEELSKVGIGADERSEATLCALMLIEQAVWQKRLAEKIIDELIKPMDLATEGKS